MHDLPRQLPVLEASVRMEVVTEPLIMFDASYRGAETGDHRLTTITPGDYTVTSEAYELPGTFSFRIHRFIPT